MKLKTKILLGYGTSLALLLLLGAWGVINLRRLGRASDAILQENYQSILAAENMIDALERQDSATLLILLENQSQGIQQFREHETIFLQWLTRAQGNITIPGESKELERLTSNYQDYQTAFSEMSPASADQQPNLRYYYDTLFPEFQAVREACSALRNLNQNTMVAASQNAQQVSQTAIWSMTTVGAIFAGLGLILSLIFSDRIVRPLQRMTHATEQIAHGNYDVSLNVENRDELGHLAQEITIMSHKLKGFHQLNVGKVIAEKQRSEAIIRSMTDGLIVVDDQLKVIAINPVAAAILKTTPTEATNREFVEVVHNKLLLEHVKATSQSGHAPDLDEKQTILELENTNLSQASNPRNILYYKFAITPVTTERGKMLGVVLLFQDVTQLKEIDQLKSEFVATASHELRTPLTGMTMSINLLLETAQQKLSESEQELLQTAQDSIQRLQMLVNDLLDLSKIESGRMKLELSPTDIHSLVERVLSSFAVQAGENEIHLTQTIDPNLPQIEADAGKISWILTNLVANALRYTESQGQIQVIAKQCDPNLHISVVDTGDGIPVEYQSRIFEKFVQVETEKDVGGSGLGLAICKEMVKAHHGEIWVESNPGEGSTFTFTLPITHPSPSTSGDSVHV